MFVWGGANNLSPATGRAVAPERNKGRGGHIGSLADNFSLASSRT